MLSYKGSPLCTTQFWRWHLWLSTGPSAFSMPTLSNQKRLILSIIFRQAVLTLTIHAFVACSQMSQYHRSMPTLSCWKRLYRHRSALDWSNKTLLLVSAALPLDIYFPRFFPLYIITFACRLYTMYLLYFSISICAFSIISLQYQKFPNKHSSMFDGFKIFIVQRCKERR